MLICIYIYVFVSQVRILDVATGQVILVSHHSGKNPYEKLDPLGLGNSGKQHAVMGGEWESATMSPLVIHPCRALKYDRSQCPRMESSTLRICMVS